MPTLHSASLPKAQCVIVGINYTSNLDLPSNALKVSDVFFKSLEVQFRQTKITVISEAPKQLRKQYEKSSFGLLGHLRLHICITGLRVDSVLSRTLAARPGARTRDHALRRAPRHSSALQMPEHLRSDACPRSSALARAPACR
ncbi:hypothetical protein CRG98_042232 [Punica granatum]|uniref:Uncharacterized protein n=1 Tax=Punica granatum TaxID=22663 RepID=A0A2I0I072_PUNGR|nr:hypothetical protein CRG98_042232 [Punica granatum]